MSNTSLTMDEHNLTPDQVGALDRRRYRGLLFLVVSGQFAIVSAVLLLWVGQDLTYSPGWVHPMFYYFLFAVTASIVCAFTGMYLRRGRPEF